MLLHIDNRYYLGKGTVSLKELFEMRICLSKLPNALIIKDHIGGDDYEGMPILGCALSGNNSASTSTRCPGDRASIKLDGIVLSPIGQLFNREIASTHVAKRLVSSCRSAKELGVRGHT